MGLDVVYGAFPANVYVFDFFHKLTGTNGMMLSMYAAAPMDIMPDLTTLIVLNLSEVNGT